MRLRTSSIASAAALGTLALAPVVSAPPAAASNEFSTAGSGNVTGAAAVPQPDTAGASADYTVGFTTPSALAGGSATVTLFSADGAVSFPSGVGHYFLLDNSHPAADQAVSKVSLGSGDHSVTLVLSASVPADSSLSVYVIGAANPTSAGTYSLEVATSADPVPVSTTGFSIVAASSGPSFESTATPALVGGTSTYTIGAFKAASALAAGDKLTVASSASGGANDDVGFPTAPSDYKITDLTTKVSSAPTAVIITGAGQGASGQTVTLTAASAIGSGDEIAVTVRGVRNPTTKQTDLISAAAPAGATAASASLEIRTPAPPKPVVSATTISLGASDNPARIGESVTYTAMVSPTPSAGTVLFVAGGKPLGAACTSVPLAAGRATCTVTYWKGGRHSVQALYSGSAGFKRSASAALNEVVSFPAVGYWLLTRTGAVFGLEGAPSLGNTPASAGDVASIAGAPSGKGYWVVSTNGTVTAFGDAHFYGDPPAIGVHPHDIVAIAPTYNGKGYWLIGADGGMFSFGNARYYGSVPGLGLHVHDIVGMVANPGGGGYLLAGADGGVFTFGKARFYGSLPGIHRHVNDVRAILPASNGTGYVLVGSDGGAFVFGSGVRFLGSLPGEGIHVHDVVGIALTPDDGGYFMAGADGNVYGFGDAHPAGMPSGLDANLPVVAVAGT